LGRATGRSNRVDALVALFGSENGHGSIPNGYQRRNELEGGGRAAVCRSGLVVGRSRTENETVLGTTIVVSLKTNS